MLMRKAYGGRSDPPRVQFRSSDAHGAAVIKVANGTSAVSIPDYKKAGIAIDRHDGAVWKSTLLIPLIEGHESKGVMMIDTRDQIEFTSEDIAIGWMIATIIALAMGSLFRGGIDPTPEIATLQEQLLKEKQTNP